MRFLTELAIFNAVLVLSVLPVVSMNKQIRRSDRSRKWFIRAVATATVAAVIGVSSRTLIRQCLRESNSGCVDPGGQGGQFILIVGFVMWALISYVLLKND